MSLCESIESAIQWLLIHHGITIVTIHNPAVMPDFLLFLYNFVMFGTVYVPPASSGYNVVDILEQFQYELDDFARWYTNLVLTGDFNTHTSVLTDVTETDTDIKLYSHSDTCRSRRSV